MAKEPDSVSQEIKEMVPDDKEHRTNHPLRALRVFFKLLRPLFILQGFGLGTLISLIFLVLGWLVGSWFATQLEDLTFDLDIAGITPQFIFGLFFGGLAFVLIWLVGLDQIDTGFAGQPTFFGYRIPEMLYNEGPFWWPFQLTRVDMRDKPKDIPVSRVITQDNTEVNVVVSIRYRVRYPFIYLSADEAEKSLENEVISDTREAGREYLLKDIGQHKDEMRQTILRGLKSGQNGPRRPISDNKDDEALKGAEEKWGIEVAEVLIKEVDLPTSLTDAQERAAVEEVEKKSETTEADTLVSLIEVLRKVDPTLSATEAANILQAERGKATRIIIEGGASDLVKAGALAGGLGGGNKPSNTDPGNPPFKGGGRRNNR